MQSQVEERRPGATGQARQDRSHLTCRPAQGGHHHSFYVSSRRYQYEYQSWWYLFTV